jgi:hypothetical protein
VRAAQRTIGLGPPAPAARGPERNGKKRRCRRPMARALKAAARLTEDSGAAVAEVTATARENG